MGPPSLTVKANDVPAVIAAAPVTARGFGANVVRAASGRLAAGGLAGHRASHLEGIGKTPAAPPCRGPRRAREGRSAALGRVELADEAADLAAMVRRHRVTRGCPVRLNPDVVRRRCPVSPSARARQVRADRDRARGERSRPAADLTARSTTRDPSSTSVAARGRRRLARGRPAARGDRGALGARLDRRRSTRSMSAAGSRSSSDRRPSPRAGPLRRELPAILRHTSRPPPTRLAIEPGRTLVAPGGWLVARVLHVRDRAGVRSSDAGMTEPIRGPCARHGLLPLTSRPSPDGRAGSSPRV